MPLGREAVNIDWELHRREIQDLYLEKDKPLKDVMKLMAETYDFRAT
jgi:Clr5 domain